MNNEELKPCPFCGDLDALLMPNEGPQGIGRSIGQPHIDTFYAHCDNCGADGPACETEPDARAAWNGRAPVSAGTIDTPEWKDLRITHLERERDFYRRRMVQLETEAVERDAAVAEAVKAHETHLMQSYAPLMDAVSAKCRIEEAEAKLRAATAPVSAVPADDRVIETLRSIACQSVGSDWTHEQAFTYCREAAKMAIASLPPSSGAPVIEKQQRAIDAISKWPEWKRDYKLTKHSEAAGAPVSAAEQAGGPSRAGQNIEGMPQPFVGAVVLLETIAEVGATAFIDGAATPMRDTCLRIAQDLRAVAMPAGGQELPALPSDDEIEHAALAHIAPQFGKLGPAGDYKATEQFARLKAFVAALAMRQPQGDEAAYRAGFFAGWTSSAQGFNAEHGGPDQDSADFKLMADTALNEWRESVAAKQAGKES